MERRDFIKSAVASAVSAGATLNASGQAQTPAHTGTPISRPMSPDMQYRDLGSTGEKVSAIGLGGYHLGRQADPAETVHLVRTAIDRGITFMDNCWDYNDGISEVRMGQALRDGYRSKVFLMTKMDGRTKEAYNLQLEQSLGRLQTDVIDLVQFHEVIRMKIRTGSLHPAEHLRLRLPPVKRARFATSGLPVIRIRRCISGCLRPLRNTASISTRYRCRSM